MRKSRRYVVLCLKLAITALLLAYVLARIPAGDVWLRIRSVHPATLIGCCIALFSLTLTTAMRWTIVLRHMDARRNIKQLWLFTIIASFFNHVLPSGMGGDLFRVWYVGSSGMSFGKAVASVVVDRFMGLLAVAIFAVAGLPHLSQLRGPAPIILALEIAAFVLMAGILIFLRMDSVSRWVHYFMRAIPAPRDLRAVRRFIDGISQTAIITRTMLNAWPDGAIALGLSLINQLVVGLTVFLLGRSIGADFDLYSVVLLFPYVVLLTMVPISFAGWGIREGGTILLFSCLGVAPDISLATSVLFGMCLLLAGLPGLWLWIARHKTIAASEAGG